MKTINTDGSITDDLSFIDKSKELKKNHKTMHRYRVNYLYWSSRNATLLFGHLSGCIKWKSERMKFYHNRHATIRIFLFEYYFTRIINLKNGKF